MEHEKPRLRTGLCGVDEVSAMSSKRVDRERKRRRHEAELYGELSRYYPRDEGRWGRPVLLRKGKHGGIQGGGNIPLTYFLISHGGLGESP